MSLMTPDLSYYDVNSHIYTLVYVRDEKYSKVRERKDWGETDNWNGSKFPLLQMNKIT